MDRSVFEERIRFIISALKNAGYDPYSQLRGYLESGDVRFITRSGGARDMIMTLPPRQIELYLKEVKEI